MTASSRKSLSQGLQRTTRVDFAPHFAVPLPLNKLRLNGPAGARAAIPTWCRERGATW